MDLRRCLKPEMRVLDLGCGPGWPSIPLSPFVKEIVAIDVSKLALKSTEYRGQVLLAMCDSEFVGVRDNAILLLLLDNGTQTAELPAITVEQIIQPTGVITVGGKSLTSTASRLQSFSYSPRFGHREHFLCSTVNSSFDFLTINPSGGFVRATM